MSEDDQAFRAWLDGIEAWAAEQARGIRFAVPAGVFTAAQMRSRAELGMTSDYYIDARYADRDALAHLEKRLREINIKSSPKRRG